MQLVLTNKMQAEVYVPLLDVSPHMLSSPTETRWEKKIQENFLRRFKGMVSHRGKEPGLLNHLEWSCLTRNISNELDHENKRNLYYVKV